MEFDFQKRKQKSWIKKTKKQKRIQFYLQKEDFEKFEFLANSLGALNSKDFYNKLSSITYQFLTSGPKI